MGAGKPDSVLTAMIEPTVLMGAEVNDAILNLHVALLSTP
jgi:hypothetical protein